jgi:NADPH:quinone reductase-like Zn-dependent oxidoreductase
MNENDTMRAIRYHQYGGPEQLLLELAPRPEVEPGALLVRVKAAGVNPWDWKLRSGALQQFMPVQLPYAPGVELAGVIEEIGPGVAGFQKGQAVYGNGGGTNAEYTVVPATSLAPMPRNLTFDEAAGVPVGADRLARALRRGDLQPGQRVLVQGAAGGVGSYGVQLARWHGAHVTGTASASNHDFVRSLGVEEVVDYQATPFETVVHDMDVVLDTVGGDVAARSLQVLRPGGIYVTVAGQPPLEEAQERGVKATGVGPSDPARTSELLRKITELIEEGRVNVPAPRVFPLAEASQAHALSQQGHGRVRIVLHVAD